MYVSNFIKIEKMIYFDNSGGHMALHFNESGKRNAQSILFIHGAGITDWMWKPQTDYFSDWDCILPHLPDHGLSVNLQLTNQQECAEMLLELIHKRANGGKAHVVGHSLGGQLAILMAAMEPKGIQHTVACSANYKRMLLMDVMAKPVFYKLSITMMKSERILDAQVKQFGLTDPEMIAGAKRDWKLLTADRLEREYEVGYYQAALPEGLEKCTVPTLILAGKKEPGIVHDSARLASSALPNAKAFLVKDADHVWTWKKAAVLNALIEAWIEERPLPMMGIETI
jgi:pimeloyl-ACP methyl ester carboxylesterase